MSSLGRLVPFASWEEWRQVGLWLFSQSPDEVQSGIDMVAAWRARGRLPLGVDITACLAETRLRDPALRGLLSRQLAPPPPGPRPLGPGLQGEELSDNQLRLQYAMALVRMVNGIADSAQKGRVAASVASLAAAAGLPRILVDLRHESTHNVLPAAPALRLAAEQALAWLQLNYWGRQEEHLAGCGDKVAELVQEYVSLHVAAAAKAGSGPAQAEGGDEEGQPDTATAAAAAAAAVSGGGKRAGRHGRGSGLSPGRGGRDSTAMPAAAAAAAGAAAAAEAGSGGGGGYTAAEGQRRRKAVLAELKMGVPRPAAGVLVDALLAAGFSQATQTAAGGAVAAMERGLATALPQLCKEWPQLPGLLLEAAVQQLASCCTAGQAGDPGVRPQQPGEPGQAEQRRAPPAAAWAAWAGRLLPVAPAAATAAATSTPKQPQQAAPGAAGGAGVVPGWHPQAPLLRELVALCLPALLRGAHQASTDWVAAGAEEGSGPTPTPSPTPTVEAVAALQATLRLLLDSWRGLGAGAGARAGAALLARCAAVVAQAPLPGVSPPPPQPQQAGQQPPPLLQDAGGTESWEGGVSALEQQLAKAWEQVERLDSKRGGEARQGPGPAKRWRRAASWAPCALGNVPAPSDPNGQPAPRELPAPAGPQRGAGLPPAGSPGGEPAAGSQGAGVVAGGRHAGAAAALCQPHEAQQQLGPFTGEDPAVPAGAEEEWPLPDPRLAWACAAAAVDDSAGLAAAQAPAPQLAAISPVSLLL